MGPVPVELTKPLRTHEVVMIGTEGPVSQCIALTPSGCSIHGRHPSVCRQVNVGDEQCQRAREQHGFARLTNTEIQQAYLGENPPAIAA